MLSLLKKNNSSFETLDAMNTINTPFPLFTEKTIKTKVSLTQLFKSFLTRRNICSFKSPNTNDKSRNPSVPTPSKSRRFSAFDLEARRHSSNTFQD